MCVLTFAQDPTSPRPTTAISKVPIAKLLTAGRRRAREGLQAAGPSPGCVLSECRASAQREWVGLEGTLPAAFVHLSATSVVTFGNLLKKYISSLTVHACLGSLENRKMCKKISLKVCNVGEAWKCG